MTTERTWLFDDLSNPAALDASSNSDGWYTPTYIVEMARRVLGAIDLDVASCGAAQSVVQAARWYGKADNGLVQPWYGRWRCNPPYSAPTQVVVRVDGPVAPPPPGSDAALALGCRCPVLENAHGNGVDGRYWMAAGCPLHGGGR